MPTMMSARPRRAICSRTAGVSAVGTRPPYHLRPMASAKLRLGLPWAGRRSTFANASQVSARGEVSHRPLRVCCPGNIAAVRRLVGESREPERSPRPEPRVDRRPDVDSAAHEARFAEHGFEDPLALEEW